MTALEFARMLVEDLHLDVQVRTGLVAGLIQGAVELGEFAHRTDPYALAVAAHEVAHVTQGDQFDTMLLESPYWAHGSIVLWGEADANSRACALLAQYGLLCPESVAAMEESYRAYCED